MMEKRHHPLVNARQDPRLILARLINFDLDKREPSIHFWEFLEAALRKRKAGSLYRLKCGEVNYREDASCGYP